MNNKPGQKFSLDLLKNPPKDCQVAYSWNWNAPVTREGIDERLDGFVKAGIQCLYILPMPKDFRPERLRTFMDPEYLTEEFFSLVRYALLGARERGISAWVYDEGGWPSGGACGVTFRQNSDARLFKLSKKDICLECDQRFHPEERHVALFEGKRRLPDDYIASRNVKLTVYFEEEETLDRNRIDGTSETATETFIENTYEGYKKAIGDIFGEDMPLFFTDEPGLLRQTLAKGLFDKFIAEYGYDLRDYVYVIEGAGELAVTEKEIQARIDWATLTGKLFRENTFRKLRDWCEKNGVFFSGHLDLDNRPWGGLAKGYFSLIDCLRQMHVPGIDVIWEQVRYPYDGSALDDETKGFGFFPRLAASAARVEGNNLALTETFSIYGDGVTPDEIRYALNFQAVRGINVFNILALPYGKTRLAALMMRPAFCPEKPGFYNLKHINEYYARLSYLLRLGEAEGDTALYHPCRDYCGSPADSDEANITFKAAGTSLEERNIPFDIIDDGCIRDAIDTGNGLKIGAAVYRHILVPECKYMPDDVRSKIAPYLGEGAPTYLFSNKNLRVLTRKLDNSRLYFIFNEGLKTASEKLNLGDSKNIYYINLQSGRMEKKECVTLSLTCGEIAVYLVTDDVYRVDDEQLISEASLTDFTAARYEQTVIEYNGIKSVSRNGEPTVDESFSGTVYYEAGYRPQSEPKAGQTARIVLRDMATSATVYADGEYLCDLGMTPTVAYFPAEKLRASGMLTVAVSNTAANEILSKMDVIKSHPIAEVGGYNPKMVIFESRRSPLKLGEVRLEILE